jgi:hypothetical protein
MAAMTDYLENKLVDHIFRDTAFTMPAALYMSLHSSNPGETGANEISGNSYARAQLDPSVSNWKSTNGTTSGASSGTGGQTANAVAITFPTPTGSWGTVTHFAIWDAGSSGNPLVYGELTIPKTIDQGDTVTFGVDALTVTFA